MIDLYGLSSPNVMKIVIMLEECDVPFRFIPVNIWTGEQFADRFAFSCTVDCTVIRKSCTLLHWWLHARFVHFATERLQIV